MKKVTPYQLATLASRIDRERCVKDPNGVLRAAVDLVRQAENELWCAAQEDKRQEQEWEEYQKDMEETRVDWAKGTKEITRERRRERAVRKFTEFLKDQAPALRAKNIPGWPGNLSDYKRNGFTVGEVDEFELEFAEWKKPRKGKQGRRISQHDGRLRTELVGLVPRRPSKSG
jgi:hypothetical protein